MEVLLLGVVQGLVIKICQVKIKNVLAVFKGTINEFAI